MNRLLPGMSGLFILAISLSACVVAPPPRPVYRAPPAVVYAPPPRPYYPPPPPRPYYPPHPRPYPQPGVSIGVHIN
jgi:hypothetical protein